MCNHGQEHSRIAFKTVQVSLVHVSPEHRLTLNASINSGRVESVSESVSDCMSVSALLRSGVYWTSWTSCPEGSDCILD